MKQVPETDDRQVIQQQKFMQQAGKKIAGSLVIKDKSHLPTGTAMKNVTAAEPQKIQNMHLGGMKISSKTSNPDKSNQKKEIVTPRNDTMVGKRVMMMMDGNRCYETVASFKRLYEVRFDNGMTEEFLRRQVQAAVVQDEADATLASKKYKADSSTSKHKEKNA